MKKRVGVILLGLIIFISHSNLFSEEVPLDIQIKLILKILEFDKNFERFGNPIKIGVSSDEALKSFNALKDSLTVKGKNFIAEKMVALADIEKYKVIYIDRNWATDYQNAAKKAIENQSLMFTRDDAPVNSQIAAISFKLIDGKPKIVLAIATARAMGSEFPANFLQLAIIIGNL